MGSTATKALRFLAWCTLVGGVILGLMLIANAKQTIAFDGLEPIEETNLLTAAFGIAMLLQGLVGWAVLMAFAENVEAVRSMNNYLRRADARATASITPPAPPG